MYNSRALSAQIIAHVLKDGISLTDAFEKNSLEKVESRDRRFIQELSYGVIRWYGPLKKLCTYLLKKPLKFNDQDIFALLLLGLYQFVYLKTADYAVINETVQAAKQLKKNWAGALINGVLRSFQRQQTVLLKKLPKEIQYAHPQWLLKKLKEAWPENWQAIIQANNQSPLMSLRVNRLKNSREDYLQKLKDNLIEAKSSAISSVGILLNETCKTHGLPDFAEGNVSIQDTAAQLSAFLLKLQPKQTVLDACAAPGGKFTHILETEVDLKTCVAIDKDENRLKKVEENLLRLKLNHDNIQLICANAQEFKTQWQGEQFDRILLDVPCSGTGVIRRHPDIKLLRREQDISKLAKQQLELLLGLWPLLRSSGLLLYVTCSILPEENQDVVQRFLLQQPDSMEDIINAEWGVACKMGRQVFPQDQGTDGFYYARVQKK